MGPKGVPNTKTYWLTDRQRKVTSTSKVQLARRLGPVQTPTASKISKAQVPLRKKHKRIVSQL
jgi:hypothetical protein